MEFEVLSQNGYGYCKAIVFGCWRAVFRCALAINFDQCESNSVQINAQINERRLCTDLELWHMRWQMYEMTD